MKGSKVKRGWNREERSYGYAPPAYRYWCGRVAKDDDCTVDPFNDFQMVRNCMPGDVFLMYSRLFHVAYSVDGEEVMNLANGAQIYNIKLSKEY